ncbi:ParB N-terminal domain-containing protein [Sphingobium sp. UBA5915]|uniref:ParB N-terminal domain-containing protein n=1 Tax=Sphingobium sp. UBA5915 TaxID=1947530 RepID=UPI0039C994ED
MFHEAAINDLVESIREKGVLQPILVRPHPQRGGGERRRGRRPAIAWRDRLYAGASPALVHQCVVELARRIWRAAPLDAVLGRRRARGWPRWVLALRRCGLTGRKHESHPLCHAPSPRSRRGFATRRARLSA